MFWNSENYKANQWHMTHAIETEQIWMQKHEPGTDLINERLWPSLYNNY